jgi:hypothetical protein
VQQQVERTLELIQVDYQGIDFERYWGRAAQTRKLASDTAML